MMTRHKYVLYLFIALWSICPLLANDQTNPTPKQANSNGTSCTCGCNCASDCSCGCEESGTCDCTPKCNCDCGCQNSGTCDCGSDCGCGCDTEEITLNIPKYENPEVALRNAIRKKGCTYGRCCHQYPKKCTHDRCAKRYWCQAHSVYLGPYDILDGDCATAFGCGRYGVWLPQDGLLFKPFIADPRQVCYSIGWRFNDQALVKNVIPVSFGDDLGLYRWCGVCPWGGMMQIDIEGALWGVFDPCHDSAPLMNADYYVAVPITYAVGRWSYRLRVYHISSHIGDEFLLNHPHFDRRNPSAEYLDLAASYYITDDIRLYGEAGWIIQHDDSFNSGNWYLEGGAELRFVEMGFFDSCQNLFGYPFFAMHFYFNNAYSRHINNTYVLGYEWGKTCGSQRRVRAFIEYHDGYSVDGQFRVHPTNYLALEISYGY